MWFSIPSLLLGVLGTGLNTIKLMSIAPRIKDGPWKIHKVTCPRCRETLYRPAGDWPCASCGAELAILSCESCRSVACRQTKAGAESVKLTCSVCSRVTKAPAAARNAPQMLLARMVTELAAWLELTEEEFVVWCEAFESELSLQPKSWSWIFNYFTIYRGSKFMGKVLSASRNVEESKLIDIAVTMIRGVIAPKDIDKLKQILRALGRDPEPFFAAAYSWQDSSSELNWARTVLGVSQEADWPTIQAAYKRKAGACHPDLLVNASEGECQQALEMMKEVNEAHHLLKQARVKSSNNTTRRSSCRDAYESHRSSQAEADSRKGRKDAG